MSHDQEILESLCISIKETYQTDIILTDLHRVIYNTVDSKINHQPLQQEFLKRVKSYVEKEISVLNKVSLTEEYTLDKDFILFEVYIENEIFGYLLLLDGMISKKQKDLANFILNYLDKIFK